MRAFVAHVSDADEDVAHGGVGVGGEVDDLVDGEPLVLGGRGRVPEEVVEQQPASDNAEVLETKSPKMDHRNCLLIPLSFLKSKSVIIIAACREFTSIKDGLQMRSCPVCISSVWKEMLLDFSNVFIFFLAGLSPSKELFPLPSAIRTNI